MEQKQIEVRLNIFIPLREQKISIPIDLAKCGDLREIDDFTRRNSSEQVVMWLTGQLPQTPENIQIERNQEQKLRDENKIS